MEEKTETNLEKIKNNDVGASLKIYAHLICILGTLYSIYNFVLEIISVLNLENRVNLITYLLLLGKCLFYIFIFFVIKDILLMYYEIHFLIKHK